MTKFEELINQYDGDILDISAQIERLNADQVKLIDTVRKYKENYIIPQDIIDDLCKNYGFTENEILDIECHGNVIEYKDSILLSTPKVTWEKLAGREWRYNRNTKELKLIRMN